MYPAIDLGAGEKERGTLETLLVSPAGRLDILLGKFGVVVLTGVLAALFSILGLYLGSTLLVAVILSAAVGVLPGVEMNALTALIPILNVSLATKAIMVDPIDACTYLF